MTERLKRLPVPILPTMVGAITLSNVLSGLGFTAIRPFMMGMGTLILVLYVIKIIKYPQVVKNEYQQMVPSSLYAGFFMVMTLLGSFYVDYSYALGKTLWSFGLAMHAVHILVFTYRFILKGRSWETTLPSWFVTYNGMLVGAVIGAKMNEPAITQALAYFGTFTYIAIVPFQLYKLKKYGCPLPAFHTQAILLAPCSLAFVALINSQAKAPIGLLYFLYVCILLTLCFIIYKTPEFFAVQWNPGYAGLTFPMAIGKVASGAMAKLLAEQGHAQLATVVGQIQWVQIFYTTVFIGYVLIKFRGMWLKADVKLASCYKELV